MMRPYRANQSHLAALDALLARRRRHLPQQVIVVIVQPEQRPQADDIVILDPHENTIEE